MEYLVSLQRLNLEGNAITDLSLLASSSNLHPLDLGRTQVRDPHPLSALSELQYR